MDYEHLSDEEIGRLIKQMVPELEIGEIMGRTEGAIKSLYHRTLMSLRDEANKLDPNHPLRQNNGWHEDGFN